MCWRSLIILTVIDMFICVGGFSYYLLSLLGLMCWWSLIILTVIDKFICVDRVS